MPQKKRSLGIVKLVQVQPDGMRITTPDGRIFDPTRRLEVDKIEITTDGVSAITPEGNSILDIHHTAHPKTHFREGNSVSIGFTAHYQAMRARFGDHIVDGSAGENVIIDSPDEIWFDDLGEKILFENPATGQSVLLDVNRHASPCEPFTHFIADSQYTRLPSAQLREALRFLGKGRRGFLLSLNNAQGQAFIQPGDRVYVVG